MVSIPNYTVGALARTVFSSTLRRIWTQLQSHVSAPAQARPTLLIAGEEDREAIRRHFHGLSLDDRRLRFGHTLSQEALNRYVDSLRFTDDMVLGAEQNGQFIALAHVARSMTNGAPWAEVGLSVSDSHRGHGLGSQLLKAALEEATRLELAYIEVHYLSHNNAMASLMARFNAECTYEPGGVIAKVAVCDKWAARSSAQSCLLQAAF